MQAMVLYWNVCIECACPRCGGRAGFDKYPFFKRYHGKKAASEILEKYPSVYPWIGKEQQHYDSHRNFRRGVLKCSACSRITKHELNWPDDAYYLWDIRGTPLWAVNKEHAEFLMSYIQSKSRNGKHNYKSYKLPAKITSAKNRELVVRKIEARLRNE